MMAGEVRSRRATCSYGILDNGAGRGHSNWARVVFLKKNRAGRLIHLFPERGIFSLAMAMLSSVIKFLE